MPATTPTQVPPANAILLILFIHGPVSEYGSVHCIEWFPLQVWKTYDSGPAFYPTPVFITLLHGPSLHSIDGCLEPLGRLESCTGKVPREPFIVVPLDNNSIRRGTHPLQGLRDPRAAVHQVTQENQVVLAWLVPSVFKEFPELLVAAVDVTYYPCSPALKAVSHVLYRGLLVYRDKFDGIVFLRVRRLEFPEIPVEHLLVVSLIRVYRGMRGTRDKTPQACVGARKEPHVVYVVRGITRRQNISQALVPPVVNPIDDDVRSGPKRHLEFLEMPIPALVVLADTKGTRVITSRIGSLTRGLRSHKNDQGLHAK